MADRFWRDVQDRVDRLALPFRSVARAPLAADMGGLEGRLSSLEGYDKYGISKKHLTTVFSMLAFLYRYYFRVRVHGIEHVPQTGRGMLVGNHSGGYAVDGAMVITSLLLDMEPPRLVHGMADKFLNTWPFLSTWLGRVGQLTGLPEHAMRLLEDDRLLLVFPEGARGTAKLYQERNSLVGFGTGFMRLALETQSPILPFAFIGGGEVMPTIANLTKLGQRFGAPYIPLTPYLLPVPLPRACEIIYGEPMHFRGNGNEDDVHIDAMVAQVKERIAALISEGRRRREAGL